MNGIDKITGKILSDAGSVASGILDNAEKEASNVKASYEKKAQEQINIMISRAKEQFAELEQRSCSAAMLEGRKKLLRTKQELIQRAFDIAFERLTKLNDSDYTEFLSRLAVNASSSGTEELILSAKDRSRFGKQVVINANRQLEENGRRAALTLSEEIRPLNGGLILKNKDVELNCTLDSIVRMAKEDLTLEVAKVLFS